MSKRFFPLLLTALLLIIALGGCSAPVPPQSGTQAEKTIKIGLILPIKGDLETYGTLCKNAIDLAVDDVNAKGGVLDRRIEVLPGDDTSSGNVSQHITEHYLQAEPVSAIVGPYNNQSAVTAAPVANKGGAPMMLIRASEFHLTQIGRYIFRSCYADRYQGTILGKFAGADLKAKKAAVVFNTGDSSSKPLIDNFKQAFQKQGGTVETVQTYDSKTTDFSAQLTEVAKAKPDVVLLTDFEDKAGLIIKKASEMGIKTTFLGTDLWNVGGLLKIAGKAAIGSYFTGHFSPDDPNKKVQEFVSLYEGDYGTKPGPSAGLSYDAINLVIEAIKTAKSDNPEDIREALANIKNYEGVTGTFTFDENRNPIKGGAILKVIDGGQAFEKRIDP